MQCEKGPLFHLTCVPLAMYAELDFFNATLATVICLHLNTERPEDQMACTKAFESVHAKKVF